MLEKVTRILHLLHEVTPDGDWAVYGSAARQAYLEHTSLPNKENPPSDIDIVTTVRTTRLGFEAIMRGLFEVLDIQFNNTEHPQYDIVGIQKRVVVTTADFGVLDFCWVDPLTYSNWATKEHQASDLSCCVVEYNFLRARVNFRLSSLFKDCVKLGKVPSFSGKAKATKQHKEKMARIAKLYQ